MTNRELTAVAVNPENPRTSLRDKEIAQCQKLATSPLRLGC